MSKVTLQTDLFKRGERRAHKGINKENSLCSRSCGKEVPVPGRTGLERAGGGTCKWDQGSRRLGTFLIYMEGEREKERKESEEREGEQEERKDCSVRNAFNIVSSTYNIWTKELRDPSLPLLRATLCYFQFYSILSDPFLFFNF